MSSIPIKKFNKSINFIKKNVIKISLKGKKCYSSTQGVYRRSGRGQFSLVQISKTYNTPFYPIIPSLEHFPVKKIYVLL
jgi:hypothetical protein